MKRNFKSHYLFSTIVTFFFIVIILLQGCSKSTELLNVKSSLKEDIPSKVLVGSVTSSSSTQTIYAGQTIKAGTVIYDDIDTNSDNVDDALQITFQTLDGWEFMSLGFFVGASLSDLPTNKSGNPIPGQFPYKSGDITGKTSFIMTIPFSTIGFSCPNAATGNYYVSAHANLRKLTTSNSYQTETGWGDGERLVSRGNWAMYNQIFISCDVNDDRSVSATTETAFAFDGDQSGCFQNYALFLDNPQRWGWTNGPYAQGTYKFKIYAGAGLCDVSKGVYVGDLTLDYSGSSAKVTYTLFGNDPSTGVAYSLREVHLYIGDEEFPKITNGVQAGEYTIAPGKFPFKATGLSGQSYSFTINNLSSNLYVIAHAVVFGLPE